MGTDTERWTLDTGRKKGMMSSGYQLSQAVYAEFPCSCKRPASSVKRLSFIVSLVLVVLLAPLKAEDADNVTFKFTLDDILSITSINSRVESNPGNLLGINEADNQVRFTLQAEGSQGDRAAFAAIGRMTVMAGGETETELREGWIRIGSDISPMVKLGKQKVAWGTGMVWNPTDYVNYAKNALNTDEPVTGRTLLLAEYPWQSGSVSLVYMPDPAEDTPRWREGKDALLALRTAFLAWETDIAFTAGLGPENEKNIGVALSRPFGAFVFNLELNWGTRPLNRYYFYEADPIGNPYYTTDADTYRFAGIFGFNRFIGENGFLTFEYYYNAAGFDDEQMEGFTDMAAYTAANLVYIDVYTELMEQYIPANLGQQYAQVSYQHTFNDDWPLSVAVVSNLRDNFHYLVPSLTYTGINDTDVRLELVVPAGNTDDGEGSLFPTHTVASLWLTVYF